MNMRLVGQNDAPQPGASPDLQLSTLTALHVHHSATGNKQLRWFSRGGQLSRIGHIPGRGRPLLRQSGLICYETRPSGFFQDDACLMDRKRVDEHAEEWRALLCVSGSRHPPVWKPRVLKPFGDWDLIVRVEGNDLGFSEQGRAQMRVFRRGLPQYRSRVL